MRLKVLDKIHDTLTWESTNVANELSKQFGGLGVKAGSEHG